jgi:hypothetical protein
MASTEPKFLEAYNTNLSYELTPSREPLNPTVYCSAVILTFLNTEHLV